MWYSFANEQFNSSRKFNWSYNIETVADRYIALFCGECECVTTGSLKSCADNISELCETQRFDIRWYFSLTYKAAIHQKKPTKLQVYIF